MEVRAEINEGGCFCWMTPRYAKSAHNTCPTRLTKGIFLCNGRPDWNTKDSGDGAWIGMKCISDEHVSAPPPPIPPTPSKLLPSSKPFSAIATSSINPAAALAVLAIIADSVENATESALVRKSPTPALASSEGCGRHATCITFQNSLSDNSDRDVEHTEPQPSYRNKKVWDDWRWLGKMIANSTKSSIDWRSIPHRTC